MLLTLEDETQKPDQYEKCKNKMLIQINITELQLEIFLLPWAAKLINSGLFGQTSGF